MKRDRAKTARTRWAARTTRVAGALALLPGAAGAAIFHGETLDKVADVMAIVVLIIVPIVAIVVFWLLHILPEKIAHKRHHPQFEAIKTLCLLSLAFGGLLWPLAWLWAYSKPVLYKMAYGTDKHPDYYAPGAEGEAEAARLVERDAATPTERRAAWAAEREVARPVEGATAYRPEGEVALPDLEVTDPLNQEAMHPLERDLQRLRDVVNEVHASEDPVVVEALRAELLLIEKQLAQRQAIAVARRRKVEAA
jgi:hypothetical protein